MNDDFIQADLRNGMVVEVRDTRRYLKIGDVLMSNNSSIPLCVYRTNLMRDKCPGHDDVMKIFKIDTLNYCTLDDIFKDNNLKLVWQRKEPKPMTVEEIKQKLEELTGEKIKIEPSRNDMIASCYRYCKNRGTCNRCCIGDDKSCRFHTYSDELLKECYERMIKRE